MVDTIPGEVIDYSRPMTYAQGTLDAFVSGSWLKSHTCAQSDCANGVKTQTIQGDAKSQMKDTGA